MNEVEKTIWTAAYGAAFAGMRGRANALWDWRNISREAAEIAWQAVEEARRLRDEGSEYRVGEIIGDGEVDR